MPTAQRSPATNFFGFGQHRHGFTSGWVLKRPCFFSAVELYPSPKHSPFHYSEDNVPARFPQVGISTPSFLGGDPVVQREAPSSYSIFWLGVPLQDLRGVTTLSHVANNPTIEKKNMFHLLAIKLAHASLSELVRLASVGTLSSFMGHWLILEHLYIYTLQMVPYGKCISMCILISPYIPRPLYYTVLFIETQKRSGWK